VIVVKPEFATPDLDLDKLDENKHMLKESGVVCPHLRIEDEVATCAIHEFKWYQSTPCASHDQIGSSNASCRIGAKIRYDESFKLAIMNEFYSTKECQWMDLPAKVVLAQALKLLEMLRADDEMWSRSSVETRAMAAVCIAEIKRRFAAESESPAAEIERLQTDLRIAKSAVDHLTERAEKAEERLAEAEEVGMYDAECLAAISTLLFTDFGQIPEHFACKRPGLQRALKWAQYRHAWVVCGPVPDGMERLLLKLDKYPDECLAADPLEKVRREEE